LKWPITGQPWKAPLVAADSKRPPTIRLVLAPIACAAQKMLNGIPRALAGNASRSIEWAVG
jgi:hypothetical protein